MNQAQEKMVEMLQEFICSRSGDYAYPHPEYSDGHAELCKYLKGSTITDDDKYTKEDIEKYVKVANKYEVEEAHKKYLMERVNTEDEIDKKLAFLLDKGIINYNGCSEVKKEIDIEIKRLINDANVEYFESLKKSDDLTFEDYMELAKNQWNRISGIIRDHYNNRFEQIEAAHINGGAMKAFSKYNVRVGEGLPPKDDGYPDPNMSFIRGQSAILYEEYGEFLNKRPEYETDIVDAQIEYCLARCKMIKELHELSCEVQTIPQDDKGYRKSIKKNQKNVTKTSKELSSIKRKFEKDMDALVKKTEKEMKNAEKRKAKALKKEKTKLLAPGKDEEQDIQDEFAASLKVEGQNYLSHEQKIFNTIVEKLGITSKYIDNPVIVNAIATFFKDNNVMMDNLDKDIEDGEFKVRVVGNGISLYKKSERSTLDVIYGRDNIVIEKGKEELDGKDYEIVNGEKIPVLQSRRSIYHRRTMTYDPNTNIEMSRSISLYEVTPEHQVDELISSVEYERDSEDLTVAKNKASNEKIDLLDGEGDLATLDRVEESSFEQTKREYTSLPLLLRTKRAEESIKQVENPEYKPLKTEELIKLIREETKAKKLSNKIENSKFKDVLKQMPQFSTVQYESRDI